MSLPDQNIRRIKQKRLNILEEQAALHGGLTPPHILIEIDRLKAELKQISAETGSQVAPNQSQASTPAPPSIVLNVSGTTRDVIGEVGSINYHRGEKEQ